VSQLNRFALFRAVGATVLLAAAASAWAQTDTLMPSYIKPGINFKQYKQFSIKPLNLDDTRLIPPPWVEKPNPKDWRMSKENQDFLRETFASASRDEKVETLGTGTLTFEAHVRDAATAELLAVYQGTQQVGKNYQANTPANKMTDIKEHFTDWGRNISRRLAAAQAQ